MTPDIRIPRVALRAIFGLNLALWLAVVGLFLAVRSISAPSVGPETELSHEAIMAEYVPKSVSIASPKAIPDDI